MSPVTGAVPRHAVIDKYVVLGTSCDIGSGRGANEPELHAGPLPAHRLSQQRGVGELSPAALRRWRHGPGGSRPPPWGPTTGPARTILAPGRPVHGRTPQRAPHTARRGQGAAAHLVCDR